MTILYFITFLDYYFLDSSEIFEDKGKRDEKGYKFNKI